MYKNIIFDLGGVVVDYAPKIFLVDHFMNEKLENELYDITFGSNEWLLMDSGELTREEGNRLMREKAAAIHRTYEVDVILSDWFDILHTKEDTVQLMKRLKKRGYSLYYLSNISHDVLDLLRQRSFFELFDGGLASCEAKLNKPDLRLYQTLLANEGIHASESIFIDDNKVNAAAAASVGITGIHFRNVRLLARSLSNYGIHLEKKKAVEPAHSV